MTTSAFNIQSGMLVGSLELVDENASGWAIQALEGELKLQKFAGAAGGTRGTAKYRGVPITITGSHGGGTYTIADVDETVEFAPEAVVVDVTDRYGAPVHVRCALEKVNRSTVVLRNRLPCVTATDNFGPTHVSPKLRGGAMSMSRGVRLPGGVAWRFGPLLADVAYSVDIMVTGDSYAAALIVAQVARVALVAPTPSDDPFITKASAEALVWMQDGVEPTAKATFSAGTSLNERARVVLAIEVPEGFDPTFFAFQVRGAGERVYVPAAALLRSVGAAQFDTSFVIPTASGIDLAVRAPHEEVASIPGYREAVSVAAFDGDVVTALPPCLGAQGGDKLRVRRHISYVQSIGSHATTMLDFQNDVVPVGGDLSDDGQSVRLALPSTTAVAIPTDRVPITGAPGATRGKKGRFSLRPREGFLRVHLGSEDASPSANFDLTAKLLMRGSVITPANADARVLETLGSVQLGTHLFTERIADIGNVAGVVFEIESAEALTANIMLSARINGHKLLGPSEHIFSLGTEFSRTCDALDGHVSTSMLDVNKVHLYAYDGNLHGDSLHVNDAIVQNDLGARALDIGACNVQADLANRVTVSDNLAVTGDLRMATQTVDVGDAGNELVFANAHIAIHSTDYTSLNAGSTVFVEANGMPAFLMSNALTFDGREIVVFDGNSTLDFVSSFSGVHACYPMSGWRGSYLMNRDAEGMLVCSSGVFCDANLIFATHALPEVHVSNTRKDKTVMGAVVRALRIGEPLPQTAGGLLTVQQDVSGVDLLHPRVLVVSVGEGACWVLDSNGQIENGDLVQSSGYLGFGEAQGDEAYRVITVAKSTTNAVWDGPQHPQTPVGFKSAFIGVTFHCG